MCKQKCAICNFQNIFLSPKWRSFVIFEFLLKMEEHKFASISLTVPDRVISSKFLTIMVTKTSTIDNFQKIFLSPKMAVILNYRIFAKNGKPQIWVGNTQPT